MISGRFPTRITVTTESVIDKTFTDLPLSSLKVSGINSQLSDHDQQLLELKGENNVKSKGIINFEYRRKFCNENIINFRNTLRKNMG